MKELKMEQEVLAPKGLQRIFLLPGELCVAEKPAFLATLLGSCVAVCIYNRTNGSAAMNHFLRDHRLNNTEPKGKFGDTSTEYLINSLMNIDSHIHHYEAKVFGGAAVVGHLGLGEGIGKDNIQVALEILEKHNIPIIEKDVGGKNGRKVYFNTETSEVIIRQIGSRHKDYSGRKIRVLLVDDSEIVRKVLRKDIESHREFEVCGEATNSYDARDKILELDPDVLSLDIIMPGLDGLDFLKKIMQYRPMPVVICSTIAKAGSPIAQKAKQLGAICAIDKDALELYGGVKGARNEYLTALKTASMSVINKK